MTIPLAAALREERLRSPRQGAGAAQAASVPAAMAVGTREEVKGAGVGRGAILRRGQRGSEAEKTESASFSELTQPAAKSDELDNLSLCGILAGVMECKRETIDIPSDLHRKLRYTADVRGCSTHQLILEAIEGSVFPLPPEGPVKPLNLEPAIVPSRGRKFDLTNEQIYELIEFP